MKKLNHTELKVLAEQIQAKLCIEAKIAQQESDEIADKANLKTAELVIKQLKRLSPMTKEHIQIRGSSSLSIDKITIEDILCKMRPIQTKIKVPSRWEYKTELFNALVIGQINSPDVESLCNSVAANYVILLQPNL